MTRISVVICTHNRADRLGPCLESLNQQTLPPEAFEIVLIDDGSTDHTPKLSQSYTDQMPNLTVIRQTNAGLGAARERGWNASTAPIVAFLDDDAEASPHWLEIALNRFQQYASLPHPPSVLGGPTKARWESKRPIWLNDQLASWLTIWFPYQTYRESDSESLFVGANMIFARSALQDVGGFNPQLGRKGSSLLSHEESELWSRLTAAGHKAAYDPDLWVWHFAPAKRCQRSWFWKRIYWEGISVTRAHRPSDSSRKPLRALRLIWAALSSNQFLKQLTRPSTWKTSTEGWFHLAYTLGCAREWLRPNH